ncbi:MAG: glycine oxidase ThiO [Solirubrobacteraceae bacterium]|nr:MAG: glycine oxidase ThiO [Solirubrobacterales bacterium]
MNSPHQHCEVAVIGGGAIGLAVAWRAAQRGMSVVVLERDEVGMGASHVAAGMLAAVGEADPGERGLLELALESAARWPSFAEELAEACGIDPGYRRCGTLRVARDRDEAEALEHEADRRRELGLAVRRLRPSEARAREPALAPTIRQALELPDDHAVDPRLLCATLARAADAAGAQLRERAGVARVLARGERVSGVELADGSLLDCEKVVVAAGCWSGVDGLVPVGAELPVRPVKGQILRLRDPLGPGLLRGVVRVDHAYLVARGDGRYVLGATVEDRGFDTTVTAGGAWELIRDVAEAVPGVLELELEEMTAGLRPGTPDNAPFVGAGVLEGLVWATGHYRNGILLCPVTAELVAAELAGEAGAGIAAAFSPTRFATVGAGALT